MAGRGQLAVAAVAVGDGGGELAVAVVAVGGDPALLGGGGGGGGGGGAGDDGAPLTETGLPLQHSLQNSRICTYLEIQASRFPQVCKLYWIHPIK